MGVPILRIRLFGALELRLGDAALPSLESGRSESLLAYLLLHREVPQARQHLAFLLWPDSTEAQARTNLRHLLHNLRRALPVLDQYLDVTPRTLQWRAGASCWLDVAAFDAALARAEQERGDGVLAALQEAVGLYTGDLLAGCYDEWLLGERERLLGRYLAAVSRLAELLEVRGEPARAVGYAEQLLRHDPLREETYRLLMRLHDAAGDRARALRVYHACAATLERELGVEPSAATREAYEALLPPREEVGGRAERAVGPALVGRAAEWARLAALWRAAEHGRAQFVLVSGEPGIGKTRLVEEVRRWCAQRGALTAGARAYAAEGALAYGPVVAWLRAESLSGHVAGLDRPHLTELARLLPELLTTVPGLARPESLPEGEQRQRLFDAIGRAILAVPGPLLLVADDLHWYDRETLHFLHYLLRVAPRARLLVAATARREELVPQHPLHNLLAGLRVLECSTEIELGRLTRGETAALAERLAGRPLAAAGADQLYGETEGSPLFVVEAMRAGWQPGQTGRSWLNPKVQAVIEARLAQLSVAARELVGVAAAIGREFTAEVLARASGADETAFVRSLDELWQRRLVREQGLDAYDFSHDLIREVAYLALSPARRRHCHLRVARALERIHANDAGPVSGQLAAHYDRAGAADHAVVWYGRAAEAAQQLHANVEAIRLLDHALGLLRALPATAERQAREVAILAALPAALAAVEGYQSSRLTEVQQRALELTRSLAIEPAPPLLFSLAIASLSRDDFATARRFAEQLRARGECDSDAVLLVEAEYMLGVTAFWQGEFHTARDHFASASAHYRPEHCRTHLLRYGQDPNVVCLIRHACALWFLGQPEAAIRARDAGLALAEAIGHPYTREIALTFSALLSLEIRELERLRASVALLAAAHGEHEARHNRLVVDAFLGYVAVLDGSAAFGIARIQRALDELPQLASTPGYRVMLLRVLLEACSAAGDARTGLPATERMLAPGGGPRLWESEAHRLRAEFLAALGAPEREIEAAFDRALQVARSQGARSLELRAATSLLGYRLQRGESTAVRDARTLLASVLDGFSEGRDTHDVRRAAALLARS
jgi:DNA-binding SARP family transcriptional activator